MSRDDQAFLYDLVRDTMRTYVEKTWGEWDEEWQYNRFRSRAVPVTWRGSQRNPRGSNYEHRAESFAN